MKQVLKRFLQCQSGATAIEYGLIAAGIAGVIILAVNQLGENVNTTFGNLNKNITK